MWVTSKEAGIHLNMNLVEEFWWGGEIFYARTETCLYSIPDKQKDLYMKVCEILGQNPVSYVPCNNVYRY